jgi:D-alanyl-D-alanine carboxypeptidase
MLFNIASNTKSFISALILKLCEEGKLSLEDSIGRYLPPMAYVAGKITIRQLLTMKSGLWDYLNDGSSGGRGWDSIYANPDRDWKSEEILSAFMGPPKGSPGGTWRYCNTNLLLAGMVVESITHTDIATLLHERILDTLLLRHTFFPLKDSLVGPVAKPWDVGIESSNKIGKAFFSLSYAAGAMCSTAEDAARWANALYTGWILTPASRAQLLTTAPMSLTRHLVTWDGYGLCVAHCSYGGLQFWGHTGGSIGYMSWIAFFPSSGASVAVLLNEWNSTSHLDQTLLALSQFLPTTDVENIASAPREYVLLQNYPNPMNPSTTISYALPRRSNVILTVFNTLGQQVAMLVNGEMEAGNHDVTFDATRLASGMYLYRLQAGEFVGTKKLILLR